MYFKMAGWEDEWIDAVEQIVRNEYEWMYANLPDGDDDSDNNNLVVLSPKKSNKVYLKPLLKYCVTYYLLYF
jgi:hypothetical protein